MDSITKKCTKCGETKPLTEFYAKHSWCKSCDKKQTTAYATKRYKENPEYRERVLEYRRGRYTGETREKKLSWDNANKEKKSAYAKKYREENKELLRENKRLYYAENLDKHRQNNRNRRARVKGSEGKFTADEFSALCEKYQNRCLKCGEEKKLTADHVVPLVAGGSNGIDNIQPLCKSCNSSKGTKTVDYRIKE